MLGTHNQLCSIIRCFGLLPTIHFLLRQAGRSALQRSAVPDTSLMVWSRAWPRFRCSLRSLTVNVKRDSETDSSLAVLHPSSAQYTAASSSHWPHEGYEGASYCLRFLGKERTSYVALKRKLIQLASTFHRFFQMIFLF